MESGNYLNTYRTKRIKQGIKAKRNHEVITHNPNTIKPGETLYVKIPKLEKNCLIVPESLKLTFNLTTSSKVSNAVAAANATFVANVGRNLVERITTKLGGKSINEFDKAYIYNTFKDFWLTDKQRKNNVLQGVDKSQRQGTDKKDYLVTAFGEKYCIPLEFELFDDHMPYYSTAIQEALEYNIKFNEAKYVVAGTASTKDYDIKDIQLEYETIYSEELANEIESEYTNGFTYLIDDIHLLRTEAIGKSKRININVDVNRKSTKGILLFFQKTFTDYDSEETPFQNPDITNVTITSEGISHCIFKSGVKNMHQWGEIKKHFMSENIKKDESCTLDVEKYYGGENFALWIDLRSTEDNTLHGSGTMMSNIKNGLQLELTRSTETELDMMVYIVADAVVAIQDCRVINIIH